MDSIRRLRGARKNVMSRLRSFARRRHRGTFGARANAMDAQLRVARRPDTYELVERRYARDGTGQNIYRVIPGNPPPSRPAWGEMCDLEPAPAYRYRVAFVVAGEELPPADGPKVVLCSVPSPCRHPEIP